MKWAGHVIWQVYGIFNELYSNNDCLRQSMSLYHVFWWYQVSDHVFWSLIQNSCTLNGLQLPVLLVNLVILIIRPCISFLNSKIHVFWMDYNFQFCLWTGLVTLFTLKIPCNLIHIYNSYLHSLKFSWLVMYFGLEHFKNWFKKNMLLVECICSQNILYDLTEHAM